MAELRSTDIIGKLRKISQEIANANSRIDGLDGTNETASISTIVTAYVTDLLTNITGYHPDNYSLSEIKSSTDSSFVNWDFYEVLYNNEAINIKSQASAFLKQLIGSAYVPVRSKVLPQYHYIITLEGNIYFPCFGFTTGLRFYEVPLKLKPSVSNDLITDAQSTSIAPSVKAIKDYVDQASKKEVYIGSSTPIEDSYTVWIDLD